MIHGARKALMIEGCAEAKAKNKNENRKKVLKCYADTTISPISKLASENSYFRLCRRQLQSSYFFVAYPGRERECRGGGGEEEKERVKVMGMGGG